MHRVKVASLCVKSKKHTLYNLYIFQICVSRLVLTISIDWYILCLGNIVMQLLNVKPAWTFAKDGSRGAGDSYCTSRLD